MSFQLLRCLPQVSRQFGDGGWKLYIIILELSLELVNTPLSDSVKDTRLTGRPTEHLIGHKIGTMHPLDEPVGSRLEAMDPWSVGLAEEVMSQRRIIAQIPPVLPSVFIFPFLRDLIIHPHVYLSTYPVPFFLKSNSFYFFSPNSHSFLFISIS